MADQPDGAALLKAARALLLETLLPALPEERRYEALMVASAMAIAAREMAAALPEDALAEAEAAILAKAIRQGQKDANAEVYEELLTESKKRLAVSNPKLLPAGRASKGS